MLWMIIFSCGPKKSVDTAPPVGWHQPEGWSVSCYHPPEYAKLNELDRREGRELAMDAMLGQWGDSIGSDTIEDIETILLGQPQKIEQLSQENLEFCAQVATGASSIDSWNSWVSGLSSSLTLGECGTHFLDTVFDYLNITVGYEHSFPICEGNIVRIKGSQNDKYRITEDGPWINAAGDQNSPSLGKSNLPCNIENCYDGMLIMKFTSNDGVETIYPVGLELRFVAPSHGKITYGINDDTFYDNEWHQSGGLIDHTSVELSPTQ
jgi:hypothetical protein